MISAREALNMTNDAVSKEHDAIDVCEALQTIDIGIKLAANQRKYGMHTKVLKGMTRQSVNIVLGNLRERGFHAQSYADDFLIVSWSPKL